MAMNRTAYTSPVIVIFSMAHKTPLLAGSIGLSTSNGAASGASEVLAPGYDGFWDDDEE